MVIDPDPVIVIGSVGTVVAALVAIAAVVLTVVEIRRANRIIIPAHAPTPDPDVWAADLDELDWSRP